MFKSVYGFDFLRSDYKGNTITITTKSDSNIFFGFNNKYTSFPFRIAYFLWIMRGSNKLDHLKFYSDHVTFMTDDNETLRGAYGPRLRYWVGPDQLQEAINKNVDIDNPEDMTKPEGIDQLECVYEDLLSGLTNSSTCVIFNPSIDYEKSNDIPDLISLSLIKDEKINVLAHFNNAFLNGNFINDYFFVNLYCECMSKLLNCQSGSSAFIINNSHTLEGLKYNLKICGDNVTLPVPNNLEEFWSDLFNLFAFEKHLRCAFNKESAESEEVNLCNHVDTLISKFVRYINDIFWNNFAYVLACYAFDKFNEGGKYDEAISRISGNCLPEFKMLIEDYLNEKQ